MSQDDWIILLFKIVIVADLVTIAGFILTYSLLAKWWSHAIGRTIVIKDILLGAALTPSALSLFLHFSRLTSHIAAWVDLALFAGIAGVMAWRITVWRAIHKQRRNPEGASKDEVT